MVYSVTGGTGPIPCAQPETTAPPPQITCDQALTASIQSFLQAYDAPLLTWDPSLAQDLVNLGNKFNLDPRLFVSIATVESGGGTTLQGNNPYGLKDGPYLTYQSANRSEARTVNKFVNVLGYSISQMYSGNAGAYCQGSGCQAAGQSISNILGSFAGNPAAGLAAGNPNNLADPCPQ